LRVNDARSLLALFNLKTCAFFQTAVIRAAQKLAQEAKSGYLTALDDYLKVFFVCCIVAIVNFWLNSTNCAAIG